MFTAGSERPPHPWGMRAPPAQDYSPHRSDHHLSTPPQDSTPTLFLSHRHQLLPAPPPRRLRDALAHVLPCTITSVSPLLSPHPALSHTPMPPPRPVMTQAPPTS
jgi:hypothetical protein